MKTLETLQDSAKQQTETEKDLKQQFLVKNRQMYEIPGHDTITPHVFERYLKCKQNLSEKISSGKVQLIDVARKPSKERKTTFIGYISSLKNKRHEFTEYLSKLMIFLPEEDLGDLLLILSKSDDEFLQTEASNLISHASEEQKPELFQSFLESGNPLAEQNAASRLHELPENLQRTNRIRMSVKIFNLLRQNTVNSLLQANSLIYISVSGLHRIFETRIRNQAKKIVLKLLENKSPKNLLEISRILFLLPHDQTESVFWELFNSPYPEIKKQALYSLWCLPRQRLDQIYYQVFSDPDQEDIFPNLIEMLNYYAPLNSENTVRQLIQQKVEILLSDKSPESKRKAVDLLPGCPRKNIEGLIKRLFESSEEQMQKKLLLMTKYIDGPDRQRVFELLLERSSTRVKLDLVSAPLYKGEGVYPRFSRTPFEKTGSETTLLGGSLKNRVLIRHLIPDAFLCWQMLYEDAELWKKHGFDYVPIEPILSYRLDQEGLVEIYSGILDINLYSFEMLPFPTDKVDDLKKDMEKILNVLKSVNIDHGHPHDQNFCLKFHRKDNGEVDFSIKPRIYLIDFDRAVKMPDPES